MKIARYLYQGQVAYGIVEGDAVLELAGDVFGSRAPTGKQYQLADVKLLVPCEPTKIIGIGANYAGHIRELGWETPPLPHFGFLKSPNTPIAHGEAIVLPHFTQKVHHEGELAIIIGKPAKEVAPEDAREYVLGYTCANDVTASELLKASPTRSKAFDTFCPLGPVVVTDVEPDALDLEVRVNGEVRQHSNTSDMVYKTDEIVSHLSQIMPLNPGDVIITGTPGGVGPLRAGDVVEVTIEGIGTLRNPVVGPPARAG